jgi:hypothetical protein
MTGIRKFRGPWSPSVVEMSVLPTIRPEPEDPAYSYKVQPASKTERKCGLYAKLS